MHKSSAAFDGFFGRVAPLAFAHRLKSERSSSALAADYLCIPYDTSVSSRGEKQLFSLLLSFSGFSVPVKHASMEVRTFSFSRPGFERKKWSVGGMGQCYNVTIRENACERDEQRNDHLIIDD